MHERWNPPQQQSHRCWVVVKGCDCYSGGPPAQRAFHVPQTALLAQLNNFCHARRTPRGFATCETGSHWGPLLHANWALLFCLASRHFFVGADKKNGHTDPLVAVLLWRRPVTSGGFTVSIQHRLGGGVRTWLALCGVRVPQGQRVGAVADFQKGAASTQARNGQTQAQNNF